MLSSNKEIIITTALTEHNVIGGQKVYLGEWCKIYPSDKENLSIPIMPFIWRDREKFDKAYYYSLDVFENSLTELTKFLNTHHNENNDIEYYRIILGTWLIHYIQTTYDKYLSLKEAKSIYPNAVFTTTPENQWVVPFDYVDFNSKIEMDEYNAHLYSRVVSYLKYDKLEIELKKAKPQQVRFVQPLSFKMRVDKFISSLISMVSLMRGQPLALIVQPYLSSLETYKLIFSSRFRFCLDHFQYGYSLNIIGIDHKTRSKSLNIGNDEFDSYLGSTLLKDIPFLYIEGYKEFKVKVDKLRIRNQDIVHTAIAWYYSPVFQFWYAKNKDKTKLIVQQHGGVNGTHLIAQEEVHWQVANEVWTFGWSGDPKHIPMTHYINMVEKAAFVKKTKAKTILLVMTAQPRYVYKFYSCHASSEMVKYIEDTIIFLKALRSEVTIIIRLYHHDYGWKIKDRILANNFNCKVTFNDHHMSDNQGSFMKQLAQCEIFVTDHLSSSYLQSLGFNIPTVVYSDPNISKFRASELHFSAKLKELKILHDTPESAAIHINQVHEEVNKWWGSSKLKQGISGFIDRHAHPDEKWVKRWVARCLYLKSDG